MKKTVKLLLAAGILCTMMWGLAVTAAAEEETYEVREFPGWNGSGTRQKGPVEGSISDSCWDYSDDDDDNGDGPGTYTYKRGWRYSPAGWWFQNSDGSWPHDGWKLIDGRWYVFDGGGHLVTGWYTDGGGNRFYLNPTDDGTYGAMRIGWQIVDGKAYYLNTMSDGTLGKLLTNTTTPDGYHVGADGVMVP